VNAVCNEFDNNNGHSRLHARISAYPRVYGRSVNSPLANAAVFSQACSVTFNFDLGSFSYELHLDKVKMNQQAKYIC